MKAAIASAAARLPARARSGASATSTRAKAVRPATAMTAAPRIGWLVAPHPVRRRNTGCVMKKSAMLNTALAAPATTSRRARAVRTHGLSSTASIASTKAAEAALSPAKRQLR